MSWVSRIWKTKTFWAACAAACTAVGLGFSGELNWGEVTQNVGMAILALFIRDSVAKVK